MIKINEEGKYVEEKQSGQSRARAIAQNGNDGLHYEEEEKAVDFVTTLSSINDLLVYKNRKYGNAALSPLCIFKDKCKVGDRLDDKLARVKNSNELKKNDIADLIGYLTLVCVEKGWDNFDEFQD